MSLCSRLPGLTTVIANHATDPVPISTTIRKCASEFKKVRVYVTLTARVPCLPLMSPLL